MMIVGRWAPAFLYAGFIYYLSSRHGFPSSVGLVNDKIGHGLLYGVFGALLARALTNSGRLSNISRGLAAALLASLYGISDEWHQSFVAGRTASASDWLADTLGGAGGVLIFLYASRRKRDARTNSRR